MPLPDSIEIVPLQQAAACSVVVPGSKSITNRALLLAALAKGQTQLDGALWSEDTQIMVEALRALGFSVRVADDPAEPANRSIAVDGLGGRIPRAGSESKPLELFVGNAGTAARFLAALVCLGHGVYRLHGSPRMNERPQQSLFQALRQLGYRVEGDRLPATIIGTGPRPGTCDVSVRESSQFASALLLCARYGGWTVKVSDSDPEESAYVAMTVKVSEEFPRNGGRFAIEADASSGSYFIAAQWLGLARPNQGETIVQKWPQTGLQIDAAFPRFWPPPPAISREKDLGDSIMTAIVLAPFAPHPVRFTELGRLRVQECERVVALRTELEKCGARIVERGDELLVSPSDLRGAEIETYNDHRMAMCFAILGLKVPGIKIKNPACVRKTFPNFFQKLAAEPPLGLGVEMRNPAISARLALTDLLADIAP